MATFRSDHLRTAFVTFCNVHNLPIAEDNICICEACHAGVPPGPGLILASFAARNKARCQSTFGPMQDRPTEWWTNALAGEAGEACNIAKKMSRIRYGAAHWNKSTDLDIRTLRDRLLREIGDVVIYADLLAQREGSTLEECVRLAFNEKSAEIGSDFVI